MSQVSEILIAASPFPTYKERAESGYRYSLPSVCRHCSSRACLTDGKDDWAHDVCEFGMSYYGIRFLGDKIIIIGLIVTDKNHKVGGERRKALANNWVTDNDVQEFRDAVEKIEFTTKEYGVFQIQTSLASLHEIRSSVTVVHSACDALIREVPGLDPSQKIENADPSLKALLQSIYLLREQLELTDVIANPESITYGRRFTSELNGCFYKMTKLYEAKAAKRNVKIFFQGDADFKFSAYNSFQRVPMILLDNAVKYSYTNKTIYVTLNSFKNNAVVKISSFGDIVPSEYREKIFDKFVRGPTATAQSSEGMGLGLFVAKEIANAHGFLLAYESHSYEGASVGNNEFILTIPRANF